MEVLSFIPQLEIEDAVQDSVEFNQNLETQEHELNDFKKKLETLTDITSAIHKSSTELEANLKSLATWINDYSNFFSGKTPPSSPKPRKKSSHSNLNTTNSTCAILKKFSSILKTNSNFYKSFNEKINASIISSLKQHTSTEYDSIKRCKQTCTHSNSVYMDLLKSYCGQSLSKLNRTISAEAFPTDSAYENLLQTQKISLEHRLKHTAKVNAFSRINHIVVFDRLIYFLESLLSLQSESSTQHFDCKEFLKLSVTQIEKITKRTDSDQKIAAKKIDTVLSLISKDLGVYSKLPKTDPRKTHLYPVITGYLLLKSNKLALKQWNRRWIMLENKSLWAAKGSKEQDLSILCEDIEDFVIKPADLQLDRQFTIELVNGKSKIQLQASSKEQQEAWLNNLQKRELVVNPSHADKIRKKENFLSTDSTTRSDSPLATPEQQMYMDSLVEKEKGGQSEQNPILSIPGNSVCADCRKNQPRWCSINLGVVLCIDCSGVHRSLGTHISKVRSLTLDAFQRETIDLMKVLGNSTVNKIFSPNLKNLSIDSNSERQSFVKDKYMSKIYTISTTEFLDGYDKISISNLNYAKPYKYIENVGISDDVGCLKVGSCIPHSLAPEYLSTTEFSIQKLMKIAVLCNNPGAILHALVLNYGDINSPLDEDLNTPIHISCMQTGPARLLAIEFLLLNGAKPDVQNSKGSTAFHIASEFGEIGALCLLLGKKQASINSVDGKGRHAVDMLKNSFASVEERDYFIPSQKLKVEMVTLLKLRQASEMEESNPNTSQTETMRALILQQYFAEKDEFERIHRKPPGQIKIPQSPTIPERLLDRQVSPDPWKDK